MAKNYLSAKEQAELILSIDTLSSKMLAQFGLADQMAQSMRASIAESLDAVQELGGELEQVLSIQKGVAEALGRNVSISAQGAKDLYASYLVTGVEVTKMVNGMADIGVSAYKTTIEMKKVVDIARESGVNAQAVSAKVIDNMKYLNQFNFEGGVSGLAKMAAQASMLRIDMKSSLDFAEKVYNPEGAIETAAALQRLGVTQSDLLDPLKLMDLSQNDPAELQNQIAEMSKRFVQLGKDGHFEIMPGAKRQMQEIAKAMGMPYTELTKMALAGADLDKKLKEIKFPDTFSEDDRKMIANMAEMGEGGQYTVTVGSETKEVGDLTEVELKQLREDVKKGPVTMEELAKKQLDALTTIAGGISKLTSTPAKQLAETYTADQVLKLAKDSMEAVNRSLPSPSKGAKEVDKLVMGGGTIKDFLTSFAKEMIQAGTTFTNEISKLNDKYPLLNNIIDKLIQAGDLIANTVTQQGQDVLKLPGQNIQLLPEDTFASFTKGKEVLSNLGNPTVNTNTTPTTTNSTMDLNHTLNINITAPSHINTDQIVEMFKDTGVSQALGVAVKKSFTNDSLTTKNPNIHQLLRTT